jgi:hypothetical protein
MLRAVRSRLDLRLARRVPYLHRYLGEKVVGSRRRRLSRRLYEIEQRGICAELLRPEGLRFVARRRRRECACFRKAKFVIRTDSESKVDEQYGERGGDTFQSPRGSRQRAA